MIESKDMEEVMTMAREELDALIATIPNYDRLDDTPYFKDLKPFKKLKGKADKISHYEVMWCTEFTFSDKSRLLVRQNGSYLTYKLC